MTDIALPSERDDRVVAEQLPTGGPQSDLVLWALEARQANSIAQALVQSSFVPASLRNKPQDVTVAILAGHEMGLKPMATLRSIDVIQGTPALRAHAMRGLLQSQGHSIQLVTSTDEQCVMRGRRKGEAEWQEVEWSIERAAKLGLTTKSQWKTQPRTMLVARATGEICRLIASDAIHAMPYVAEELGDPETGGGGQTASPAPGGRMTTAELVGTARTVTPDEAPRTGPKAQPDQSPPPEEPPVRSQQPATQKQRGLVHSLAKKLGLDTAGDGREEYLALMSDIAARPITSSNDLSKTEAGWVIDIWTRKVAEIPAAELDQEQSAPPAGPTTLPELIRRAGERGISEQQVRAALEQEYALPVYDLSGEQLQEFTMRMAMGRIRFPQSGPDA